MFQGKNVMYVLAPLLASYSDGVSDITNGLKRKLGSVNFAVFFVVIVLNVAYHSLGGSPTQSCKSARQALVL